METPQRISRVRKEIIPKAKLEQQEVEESKNGKKENGRKVESGSAGFRKKFGRSIGRVQINVIPVQAKRASVVKIGRKSLLSRIRFHGVDSG